MNFLEHGIERKEFVPRVPKFNEIILAATFASNRHLNPEIKQIDLGSVAYEAQLLRDKTANDPKRREAGKLILIKNDNFPQMGQPKVIIEREARFGEEGSIFSGVKIRKIKDIQIRRKVMKLQRQDLIIAASLHTHRNGMPPSPEDMGRIMLNDIENIHAAACVFVATPELNYLVLRGPETPSLKQRDISAFIQAWEGKIQKAWLKKIKEAPMLKLGKVFVKEILTRLLREQYVNQEFSGLDAVIQQEILNQVIRNCGLLAFTGRADSPIVNRVTG
ncbi:hypothetical protein KJ980_03675 [Patescibacteria group bacterium]|nr:hypothetical protein [Patescibacteria group bacterium]MBU4098722.1 hypothetical protein [Patescibacteria group bacterium]